MEDFDKLCGILPEKPFECVGSRDEVNASIVESIKKYDEAGITLPVLLEHYKSACPTNESAFNVIINQYSTEHGLNEYFEKIIKDALK